MKQLLHKFALHMQVERTPLEAIEYHQLVKFVEWIQENAPEYGVAPELLAALEEAREAIASLPADALGSGRDGELEWSIRDELIDKISRPIAKAKGEG